MIWIELFLTSALGIACAFIASERVLDWLDRRRRRQD